MYSYEDRIRVVQLYIKLGKRTGAAIRQLGYPTKNSLKAWYQKYERCQDLPKCYVRAKQTYSDEQQSAAVEHYVTHDRCLATTVKAVGYPARRTLAAWVEELHPESRKRLVGKATDAPRPAELKEAAVIALCTRQGSAQAIAKSIGVSRPTLYNWRDQLLGREVETAMKRPQDSASEPERVTLEQQLESLRREVRHLQLERDL